MNETQKPMTVEEAIRAVIYECKDQYAVTYAQAIPTARRDYGDNGVRSQLLYVMNNLQYWRGERARTVKAVLKAEIARLGKLDGGR